MLLNFARGVSVLIILLFLYFEVQCIRDALAGEIRTKHWKRTYATISQIHSEASGGFHDKSYTHSCSIEYTYKIENTTYHGDYTSHSVTFKQSLCYHKNEGDKIVCLVNPDNLAESTLEGEIKDFTSSLSFFISVINITLLVWMFMENFLGFGITLAIFHISAMFFFLSAMVKDHVATLLGWTLLVVICTLGFLVDKKDYGSVYTPLD